jgi:hypothetical protein
VEFRERMVGELLTLSRGVESGALFAGSTMMRFGYRFTDHSWGGCGTMGEGKSIFFC